MDLKQATIKDDRYVFEFEERYTEQNVKRKITMPVRKRDFSLSRYGSALVETKEVQQYIIGQVRDLCVYIADDEHRELFYKTAEFITKAQGLPINIKSVPYPGSALVLLEYGILGIDDESVKRLELSILDGFTGISYENEPIEKEEEEPKNPLDELEEESFPFGGTDDSFIEDGEFSIGEVEEEGEKDD